ncbi:carbonic anhydrase [Pararhodobacter sp.]|jgi:carbonic anhydrase|uniref:carbonic anhydrase n=1 Tax=Pararhodobacter sp. TaxID=2127056 RepID=UPI002FDCA2EC
MTEVQKLPSFLVSRYRAWQATTYAENKSWYHHLADQGQHPRSMVIACCDSRVHVEALFNADVGEFFIHRNIANFVPPYTPDGQTRGTSAAVEYGVSVLKVAHLIVMGHSNCGGIRGCHDMCAGTAPELRESTSFIGHWLMNLRQGYDNVAQIADEHERLEALEREGIRISAANLMSFPFVRDAVAAGALSVHGLWNDIGKGRMEYLDGASGAFLPV